MRRVVLDPHAPPKESAAPLAGPSSYPLRASHKPGPSSPQPPGAPGRAHLLARRNFRRNCDALPPQLAAALRHTRLPQHEWVFARDGCLTARLAGSWLGGTGLPRRVGEALVACADISRPALCLVAPTHGLQVTCLLERMAPSQALVAAFVDLQALAWAVHCVDLSPALAAQRLHLLAGPDVGEAILALAERVPGLALPDRLFRPGDADTDAAANLLDRTRHALRQASERRARRLWEMASESGRRDGNIAVVAPGAFRTWGDAGERLWRSCAELDGSRRVDSDHPASASPLALAQAAAGGRGVITADLLRQDLPGVVHESVPWLTWLTQPRPPVRFAGGRDGLLLADQACRQAWLHAGWPEEQLEIATWPAEHPEGEAGTEIILPLDLPPRTPPAGVERYSSKRLLWERIEEQLQRDPFSLHGLDPADFILARAAELGVTDVPLLSFTSGCVLPAYARGIAHKLCREGVGLRIYGTGWETDPALATHWAGPIQDGGHFRRLCDGAALVVAAFPGPLPALASGGPRTLASFVHDETSLLGAVRARRPAQSPHSGYPELGPEALRSLLERLWS